jgi:hypothetical protein
MAAPFFAATPLFAVSSQAETAAPVKQELTPTPSAGAVAANEERNVVLRLLSGYEWQLLPASFQQLPADVYQTLISIARDDTVVAYTRGRAMVALSLYENDTVFAFFHEAASDNHHDAERRRAVEGLCEVFSGSKADAVKALLTPMLKSGDVHLRITAARCLVDIQELQPDAKLAAQLADYGQSIKEDWELQAAGVQSQHAKEGINEGVGEREQQ